MKAWKRDLICIMFLFLSTCIFFWKILLNPEQLLCFFDIIYTFYPWSFFIESMLEDGQLPLWLPYSFGGEPFIGNMQTAVFYPLNIILFSIFPTNLALGIGYLLHIFLAGLFMYILMRYLELDWACSFLSSIIFMYSGFFLVHTIAGHYSMISAASWLPLIFLLFGITLKKTSVFYGLLTGIPIGLQFLAGHMQISLYTMYALCLYLVFRSLSIIKKNRDYQKVSKLFTISALAVAIGVFLSAIQLIPTFEFSRLITRAGGIPYEYATIESFPRQNLITFVLPNFYGNFFSYWGRWDYDELFVYLGILPLILIFFAIYLKRSENEEREYILFFTGLAVLSLVLAFGKYTRLYWWVWKYVPGVNLFRCPSRFNFLFTFSAAILSGFGFSFLKGNLPLNERKKVWKVIKILVLLIALVVCDILIFTDELLLPVHINRRSLRFIVSIITHPVQSIRYYADIDPFPLIIDWFILMALSIGSVALLALQIKMYVPCKFKFFNKWYNLLKINLNVIIILFVLSNLWVFHIGFIITENPNNLYKEPDYITFLKNNSEHYRVYDVHWKEINYPKHYLKDGGIPDNSQIIYGIHKLSSYNPLQLNTYKTVLSWIHDLENNTHHPILNLLNVKYILTSNPLENSGFELVWNNKTILFKEQFHTYIYENKQVLPKAFVLHKVKILSEDDVIQELRSDSFNPIHAVILEQKPPNNEIFYNESNEGIERAEIRYYSPNEIIVEVNITQPGFLVLSENYYPGWKVFVDGEQQEIYKAYYTLRMCYLAAGLHNVRFTYDPASLRIGSWITFLTSIFLVVTISMKIIKNLNLLREHNNESQPNNRRIKSKRI
ncbi:MAG: YfhO family protein [Candidatus Hodarchaeota archaeon]